MWPGNQGLGHHLWSIIAQWMFGQYGLSLVYFCRSYTPILYIYYIIYDMYIYISIHVYYGFFYFGMNHNITPT